MINIVKNFKSSNNGTIYLLLRLEIEVCLLQILRALYFS
jgi:hypothetical protein